MRCLLVFVLIFDSAASARAQATPASAEVQIRQRERDWNAAIQKRDVAHMDDFLAENYLLAIGIEGHPLVVVPRQQWLETLKVYEIESLTLGDMHVSVYGDVAVVILMYTQKAHVPGPRDVNGNFVLTDIWIKTSKGWRVNERHSSRQEKLPSQTSH